MGIDWAAIPGKLHEVPGLIAGAALAWRRIVDSDTHGRCGIARVSRRDRRASAIESNTPTLSIPLDHVLRRAEPWLVGLQTDQEIAIEVSPQSFRRMAAVMPQNGQHSATRPGLFNQQIAAALGFLVREVKIRRVEEGA